MFSVALDGALLHLKKRLCHQGYLWPGDCKFWGHVVWGTQGGGIKQNMLLCYIMAKAGSIFLGGLIYTFNLIFKYISHVVSSQLYGIHYTKLLEWPFNDNIICLHILWHATKDCYAFIAITKTGFRSTEITFVQKKLRTVKHFNMTIYNLELVTIYKSCYKIL